MLLGKQESGSEFQSLDVRRMKLSA